MPRRNEAANRWLVIMGVSGAGKSTIAAALSEKLGWEFRDADAFHPPENVAKMAGGLPLVDADRWPWLQAIASWLALKQARGEAAIVTCSALKRVYRDRLRQGCAAAEFIFLKGPFQLIAERVGARQGHFMPPALLESQFNALEEPGADEAALVVDINDTPEAITRRIEAALAQSQD